MYAKGCTSNEKDQELAANNDQLYSHEPIVAEYALEDIEFVVYAPAATQILVSELLQQYWTIGTNLLVLIENLHPDEDVENKRLKLILFVCGLIRQNRNASEV